MPNFTTEDLLVYLYEEMESEKACELEAALQSDWALQQKLTVMKEAQDRLHQFSLQSPRSSTIAGILQYAQTHMHLTN